MSELEVIVADNFELIEFDELDKKYNLDHGRTNEQIALSDIMLSKICALKKKDSNKIVVIYLDNQDKDYTLILFQPVNEDNPFVISAVGYDNIDILSKTIVHSIKNRKEALIKAASILNKF